MLYDVIKGGFENYHSKTTRLEFKHHLVTLNVSKTYHSCADLTGVWFRLHQENIPDEQVRTAIALFPQLAYRGGLTYYNEIHRLEDPLPLDEIVPFYISNKENLGSISDNPPKADLLNNTHDGSIEIPSHKFAKLYCSFEEDYKEYLIWTGVVLYKDGMALRFAKQENWCHHISPTLDEISKTHELDNLQMFQILQIEKPNIPPVIENSSNSLITPQELDYVAQFASKVVGVNIESLKYTCS
jgi:hypothetical protein